jgi:hypothetical protein
VSAPRRRAANRIESSIELQAELGAAESALDAAIAAIEVLPRTSKRGISQLVEDAFTRVRTVKASLEAMLLRNDAVHAAAPVLAGHPEAPLAADASAIQRAPDGAPPRGSHSPKRNSTAHRRRRSKRGSGREK